MAQLPKKKHKLFMISIFACLFYNDISTSSKDASIVDFKVDKKTPQPLNVECWHKIGEIFSQECTKNGLT